MAESRRVLKKPISQSALMFLGLGLVLGAAALFTTQKLFTGMRSEPPPLTGPWGQLTSSPLVLEPDPTLFRQSPPEAPVRWVLHRSSQDTRAFLESIPGLSVELRERWMKSLQSPHPQISVLQPTHEDVLSLSPSQRSQLYLALAQWPENSSQVNSYVFRSLEDFRDYTSDLSTKTQAFLEKFLYSFGTHLYFSDTRSAHALLPNPQEKPDLLKTFARSKGYLLKILISPNTPLDNVARYWSHDAKKKNPRSILNSLQKRHEEGSIDIVHFLPPLARKLLYTYPSWEERDPRKFKDCLWTSLNFFYEEPRDEFFTAEGVRRELAEYDAILPQDVRLGDIVLLLNEKGAIIHAANYIAGDFVFTKNGRNLLRPWTLSPLSELVSIYSKPGIQAHTQFIRRKKPVI